MSSTLIIAIQLAGELMKVGLEIYEKIIAAQTEGREITLAELEDLREKGRRLTADLQQFRRDASASGSSSAPPTPAPTASPSQG